MIESLHDSCRRQGGMRVVVALTLVLLAIGISAGCQGDESTPSSSQAVELLLATDSPLAAHNPRASRIADVQTLPAPASGAKVLAAAVFEPHGLAIPQGIDVRWPLETPKTPGSSLYIATLDERTGRWLDTGQMATVSSDGRSATGKLFHFSTNGVLDSSSGAKESDTIAGNTAGTNGNGTATRPAGSAPVGAPDKIVDLDNGTPLHEIVKDFNETYMRENGAITADGMWQFLYKFRDEPNLYEKIVYLTKKGARDPQTNQVMTISDADNQAMGRHREAVLVEAVKRGAKKLDIRVGRSNSGNTSSGFRSDVDQTFFAIKQTDDGRWVHAPELDTALVEAIEDDFRQQSQQTEASYRPQLLRMNVSSFEGRIRFPDPRVSSIDSFSKDVQYVMRKLRSSPGAYYFEGAVVAQMQKRALRMVLDGRPEAFEQYTPDGQKLPFDPHVARRVLFEMDPDRRPGHEFGAAVQYLLQLESKSELDPKAHLRCWEDAAFPLWSGYGMLGDEQYLYFENQKRRTANKNILGKLFPQEELQARADAGESIDPARHREAHRLALEISRRLRMQHMENDSTAQTALKRSLSQAANKLDLPEALEGKGAARDRVIYHDLALMMFPNEWKELEQRRQGEPDAAAAAKARQEALMKQVKAYHATLANEFVLATVNKSAIEAGQTLAGIKNGDPLAMKHYEHVMRMPVDPDDPDGATRPMTADEWTRTKANLEAVAEHRLRYALYDLGLKRGNALHKDLAQRFGTSSPARPIDFLGTYLSVDSEMLATHIQRTMASKLGYEGAETAVLVDGLLESRGLRRKTRLEFLKDNYADIGAADMLLKVVRAYRESNGDWRVTGLTAVDEFVSGYGLYGQAYGLAKSVISGAQQGQAIAAKYEPLTSKENTQLQRLRADVAELNRRIESASIEGVRIEAEIRGLDKEIQRVGATSAEGKAMQADQASLRKLADSFDALGKEFAAERDKLEAVMKPLVEKKAAYDTRHLTVIKYAAREGAWATGWALLGYMPTVSGPYGTVMLIYTFGEHAAYFYTVEFANPARDRYVDALYRGFDGPGTFWYAAPPPWTGEDAAALKRLETRIANVEGQIRELNNKLRGGAPLVGGDALYIRSTEVETQIKERSGFLKVLQQEKQRFDARKSAFLEHVKRLSGEGSWAGGSWAQAGLPVGDVQEKQVPFDNGLLKDVPLLVLFTPGGMVDFRLEWTAADDAALTSAHDTITALQNNIRSVADSDKFLDAVKQFDELMLKKQRVDRAARYMARIKGQDLGTARRFRAALIDAGLDEAALDGVIAGLGGNEATPDAIAKELLDRGMASRELLMAAQRNATMSSRELVHQVQRDSLYPATAKAGPDNPKDPTVPNFNPIGHVNEWSNGNAPLYEELKDRMWHGQIKATLLPRDKWVGYERHKHEFAPATALPQEWMTALKARLDSDYERSKQLYEGNLASQKFEAAQYEKAHVARKQAYANAARGAIVRGVSPDADNPDLRKLGDAMLEFASAVVTGFVKQSAPQVESTIYLRQRKEGEPLPQGVTSVQKGDTIYDLSAMVRVKVDRHTFPGPYRYGILVLTKGQAKQAMDARQHGDVKLTEQTVAKLRSLLASPQFKRMKDDDGMIPITTVVSERMRDLSNALDRGTVDHLPGAGAAPASGAHRQNEVGIEYVLAQADGAALPDEPGVINTPVMIGQSVSYLEVDVAGPLEIQTRMARRNSWNPLTELVITSEALPPLDKAGAGHWIGFSIYTATSPDGPWDESTRYTGWVVTAGTPVLNEEQLQAKFGNGRVAENQFVTLISPVYPRARSAPEDFFKDRYYRVGQYIGKGPMQGGGKWPFDEEEMSNVVAPDGGTILWSMRQGRSSPDDVNATQENWGVSVAMSYGNQAFNIHDAKVKVTIGDWTGYAYPDRAMRVLIDEIRKGKRNNARDNYASVAAPFHPDGVTVRVEATGRGHSASDESRIDAAFKENWESQRDRQLQDWTKGRDDQLKRLNDFIQSARKRIGLEREKLEKARQEGKGADYSALGYQRAIADYELRIERTQKVEIPRAEAYFRFSQARTNRDYAQALAAARELQKLAPLENELKVALTDRLWELEQAQLALLNKQEFRDRAVQRDKEVRQRLVGEHRRETIKCMNDLAWAGYFAGDFDAVREARTTLIDIYSKPESEQETDSQRNSREARLAGTLVTFATETATFTGDRRAAADLYTRGQKIYEQLRNKPWSPDTDPWLPGWWPDRQD